MAGQHRAGAGHDSETRHIRKAYEKTSLELMVVRRFQSPTGAVCPAVAGAVRVLI
jgi:hypothetical protein